jgi:hypothetical protein
LIGSCTQGPHPSNGFPASRRPVWALGRLSGGAGGFALSERCARGFPQTLVNEELKQYFRPEFLNRLDEIIVFRQLTKAEVKEIADIMLTEVSGRRLSVHAAGRSAADCSRVVVPSLLGLHRFWNGTTRWAVGMVASGLADGILPVDPPSN